MSLPKSLDVGCGVNPKGTVNIDVNTWALRKRKISNFVLADAEHLPFIENCFRKVYARHILEHLPNPLQALEEWKRVLMENGVLIVTTPNIGYWRFIFNEPTGTKSSTTCALYPHLLFFTKFSLSCLLRKIFPRFTIKLQRNRKIDKILLLIFRTQNWLYSELQAVCYKFFET